MDFPKFKHEYHLKGSDLLPHRSPFLFVDELIAADETGAIGTYTYTEEKNDFFKGHFPGYPIVPGVVLVETMAQAAGAGLVARKFFGDKSPGFVLAKVEEAKFRRPVRPGDKFVSVAKTEKLRRVLGTFSIQGFVNGELAAEARVMCMLGGEK